MAPVVRSNTRFVSAGVGNSRRRIVVAAHVRGGLRVNDRHGGEHERVEMGVHKRERESRHTDERRSVGGQWRLDALMRARTRRERTGVARRAGVIAGSSCVREDEERPRSLAGSDSDSDAAKAGGGRVFEGKKWETAEAAQARRRKAVTRVTFALPAHNLASFPPPASLASLPF